MAITRNLVEMMNGTVSVRSRKGEGSEFTVTVTLIEGEREGLPGALPRPREMKVLVVDDDPIAREHARIALEGEGIDADTCPDGREALRMIELRHAKHEPYHLALVDWRMPDPDGVALARQIRRRGDGDTTIILLTAYNWDDIADEALAAGVDGFMSKPLFARGILDAYEKALGRRRARRQEPTGRAELAGKRALLAEDVLVNAEIIREILGMRRMEVEHVENGRMALERFEQSPEGYYDAILMDVRMPEMDGLQATAAIRALPRGDARRVPIIALTANAFDEDVQLSLQAGMTAHLSKPVEPERLYETLEGVMGQGDEELGMRG